MSQAEKTVPSTQKSYTVMLLQSVDATSVPFPFRHGDKIVIDEVNQQIHVEPSHGARTPRQSYPINETCECCRVWGGKAPTGDGHTLEYAKRPGNRDDENRGYLFGYLVKDDAPNGDPKVVGVWGADAQPPSDGG
jgi:hypothetical protein